jgi:HEAT repeat protein
LPDAPLVAPADLIKLRKVIDGAEAPIETRIGLLAELERRGLLDGAPHWLRLLRTTRGPDRLAVIPVAGLRQSAPVQAELEKILFEPDVDAASAAAVALGSRGNVAAVAPLTKALHSRDARLATAAIRGLGRIGTPEARAAIDAAAAAHPDPAVRRRAQAEARLLAD